jgi:anti-sigma factor RsiW
MTQHLGKDQIRRFLNRELTPRDLLLADDHLASCAECVAEIAAQPAVTGAAGLFEQAVHERSASDEDHLNYEELSAYVDRKLEAETRPRIEAHLAVCHSCANEVEELGRLAQPIAETAEVKATTAHGSLQSIRRWFSQSGFGLAAAAVAIVVLAGIGWLVWEKAGGAEKENAKADRTVFTPATRSVEPPHPAEQSPANASDSEGIPSPPLSDNAATTEQKLRSTLVDGGQTVGLDESGRLVGYSNAGPRYREAAAKALESGNVVISPEVEQLRPASGAAMGDGPGGIVFALRGPSGKVISEDRPVFNWQPLDGAEGYRVSVYDTKFNRVAESETLHKTSWSTKLPRGKILIWQVTAVKDGQEFKSPSRPAPDARFKIVGGRELAEIQLAKRQFPNARLLLGILYAEAGLLDEAAKEFEALRKQNPNSEQARLLLQRINAARSGK